MEKFYGGQALTIQKYEPKPDDAIITFMAEPWGGKPAIILRRDGRMEIGEGLSQDEATQAVAKGLVVQFEHALGTRLGELSQRHSQALSLVEAITRLSTNAVGALKGDDQGLTL